MTIWNNKIKSSLTNLLFYSSCWLSKTGQSHALLMRWVWLAFHTKISIPLKSRGIILFISDLSIILQVETAFVSILASPSWLSVILTMALSMRTPTSISLAAPAQDGYIGGGVLCLPQVASSHVVVINYFGLPSAQVAPTESSAMITQLVLSLGSYGAWLPCY
jgi:hypothetical protein